YARTRTSIHQLIKPSNKPPSSELINNTFLRNIRISGGGGHLQVRFSNEYVSDAVTVNTIHGASHTVRSVTYTDPDRSPTFYGISSVIIRHGQTFFSDCI
ncbi:MAG: hypothetical protein JW969_17875, partial [Spirochaetales bacterium]|nr:hypothetical protein [Spirochaetales bacterium]